MECASLFKQIGINYPQAIISTKPMKFTVLYTATVYRGMRLLRKSWVMSIGLHQPFLFVCLFALLFAFMSSPRAHIHVVGMLRFMSDINQPSLPTSFYSVLVSVYLFMALSVDFHSINSPDNSQFSHSVLPVLSLPYWSFQLYVSLWKSPSTLSPQAHLHVVGMFRFMSVT